MNDALPQFNQPIKHADAAEGRPVRRDEKGRLLPGHNLRSPGVSANAGATLMQHVARMSHYTPAQLKQVATDHELPALRIAAANWLLRTQSDKRLKSGASESGAEIDRLLDRTIGRPRQHVEVEANTRHEHLMKMTEDNLKALDTAFEGLDDESIDVLP